MKVIFSVLRRKPNTTGATNELLFARIRGYLAREFPGTSVRLLNRGTTSRELCQGLNVSSASMQNLVAMLEARQHIVSRQNGRRLCWFLTDLGRAAQKADPRPRKKPRPADNRNLSLALRFKVFKRDDYRCQVCGASASDLVRLEIDHKKAWSKGGKSTLTNLWTLCLPCNRGKHAHAL